MPGPNHFEGQIDGWNVAVLNALESKAAGVSISARGKDLTNTPPAHQVV